MHGLSLTLLKGSWARLPDITLNSLYIQGDKEASTWTRAFFQTKSYQGDGTDARSDITSTLFEFI